MAGKDPRIWKPDLLGSAHPLVALIYLLAGLLLLTCCLGLLFLTHNFPGTLISAGMTGGLGFLILKGIISSSVIGKKVTVGLDFDDRLVWHIADQLDDPDHGYLSMYATVRLAGLGNEKRLFPIYEYNPEKRTYTRLRWSLRKRGRKYNIFELVDADGLALYRGPYISSLFKNARETPSLTQALID
jgi:hypothetical protein